jgi:hypothetical protein
VINTWRHLPLLGANCGHSELENSGETMSSVMLSWLPALLCFSGQWVDLGARERSAYSKYAREGATIQKKKKEKKRRATDNDETAQTIPTEKRGRR